MQIIFESVFIFGGQVQKEPIVQDVGEQFETWIINVTSPGQKKTTVLKDKTIDVNARNNTESVSERTAKQMLHKNQIYRRLVKKNLGLLNTLIKKGICLLKRIWTFEQNYYVKL